MIKIFLKVEMNKRFLRFQKSSRFPNFPKDLLFFTEEAIELGKNVPK